MKSLSTDYISGRTLSGDIFDNLTVGDLTVSGKLDANIEDLESDITLSSISGVGLGLVPFGNSDGSLGTSGIFNYSSQRLTVSNLDLTSTTETTAIGVGALTIAGGVGIAKSLRIGGNCVLSGILVSSAGIFSSTVDASSSITGALVVNGGVGIAKSLFVGGCVVFSNISTTSRDALVSPANGSVIYNSTTHKLQVRANGIWVDLH